MPVTRVLIRVIKRPRADEGEQLALYLDSRTATDPNIVVYSLKADLFRVEHHRQLMHRTRRATPTEMAEAREHLRCIGETVLILQSAPRTEETRR